MSAFRGAARPIDASPERYYSSNTILRIETTMPAVTLKLSDDLKARINELAAASGKSPHAFMVDALATQAAREESRRAFAASALEAREEVARYGQVMEASDVHKWLLARSSGKKAARPRAKKLLK